MNRKSTRTALCAMFITTLLTACGGKVLVSVSEANRDTTGKYDGVWTGVTTKTPSPQYFGDWRAQCIEPDAEINLLVKDGQVSMINEDVLKSSYIDGQGRFRMVIPSDLRIGESGASEAGLNSGIKFIIEGMLGNAEPSGRFIVGVAEFAYNGCTSSMTYEKADLTPKQSA